MKPEGAPPDCPRRDGTSGPRSCGYALICRHHLHYSAKRGRGELRRRMRLLVELDDTCSVDVAERARAASPLLGKNEAVMTTDEIALMNGISRQAADQNLASAIRKVRAALGIEVFKRAKRRIKAPG